jgi:hypothetical protein
VCRPIAVDGNVITLGIPESQSFLRDVLERRRALIEEGISEALGRPIAVRCVATNLDVTPAPDPEADQLLAKARQIFEELVDAGEVN